jgi:hypothetical protein
MCPVAKPVLKCACDSRFRVRPPFIHIESERLSDLEYLRQTVLINKECAMEEPSVRYQLKKLRAGAAKDSKIRKHLNEIYKSLLVDGRQNKDQGAYDETKDAIRDALNMFEHVLRSEKGQTVRSAIDNWVMPKSVSPRIREKREKEANTYEKVYKEYKKVFNHLRKNGLSECEILDFFRHASDNIDKPNVTVFSTPDWRLLTYVKQMIQSYYVVGSDVEIVISSNDPAE